MMSYLFRYGMELGVKLWSIFYFPKGMERKEGCVTQKSAAVILFVLFVMGQKMVLNGQSLNEAFIRNILLFLVTMGMMLAFYNGQTGYRVFLGSVLFFSWSGWLKLFTPFVFSALHLPTFGYGINEVFPECYPSAAEGICRILVLVVMKRFAFHISGDREISWGEIFFSLLPALIDHTTILILYYLMIVAPSLQSIQIAREVTMLILMLVFGMPCMLVATEQLFQYKENKMKMAFMEAQMNTQLQEFEKKQASDARIRSLYHDFQNHLSVIRTMASKDGTEVNRYVDELIKQADTVVPSIVSGHPVLDTLLNQKAEVCKSKNICLECMADFKDVHFIRYTDMVALFTNAIDNAIEALEKVPEEKRVLTVSTGIIGNFVVAKFTNPYVGGLNQEKGRFLTTKKDGGFHGIGLSNIKRIVDSYKGVCQIETKDQVFMLKWMVPFPDDEA